MVLMCELTQWREFYFLAAGRKTPDWAGGYTQNGSLIQPDGGCGAVVELELAASGVGEGESAIGEAA